MINPREITVYLCRIAPNVRDDLLERSTARAKATRSAELA